jgi:hypothetical protein
MRLTTQNQASRATTQSDPVLVIVLVHTRAGFDLAVSNAFDERSRALLAPEGFGGFFLPTPTTFLPYQQIPEGPLIYSKHIMSRLTYNVTYHGADSE